MKNNRTAHGATAWVYLSSAAFSNFGNAIANTVWPWLVLEKTGDPAAAGLVAALIAVPTVLVSLVGGHLIDAIGRQRMSVISDAISALSVVTLIAADNFFTLNISWLVFIGIFGAVGDIPGYAARSALLNDVAITSGRSLKWIAGSAQTVSAVTFLLGPALAGILIAAFPVTSVLWITAACSLIAACVTWSLNLKTRQVSPDEEVAPTGWRAWLKVIEDKQIRLIAITGAIAQILVMPYVILVMPAHFSATNNPLGMGISLSSFAVGMMIGGIASTRMPMNNRLKPWLSALFFYCVGFGLMSVLKVPLLVMGGMALAGIGSGIVNPFQALVITENTGEKLRGRAFSLIGAIALLTEPIGLSLATVALNYTTIYTVAIFVAAAWAMCSIWSAWYGFRVFARNPVAEQKSGARTVLSAPEVED